MTKTQLTTGEIRGFARYAARRAVPAGRGYRELCRAHNVPSDSWASYADAYDSERATLTE